MTHGWQNLAPERQRTPTRENALIEIQKTHPGVWDTLVGEDYAYFVGSQENPRLVGIAWRSRDSWFFACMNEIAFEIGVSCRLITENGKNRIVPCSSIQPDENRGLRELAHALQQPIQRTREPRAVTRRVFREDGQWWVEVETRTHLKHKGPYQSKAEAERKG